MTSTISIRSADWVSATAKIHWRSKPCKGAKLLNGMSADAFYEASCKSQSYCLRCASRAHGELMKEGKGGQISQTEGEVMRIEDLDEFQGLTPQMVREWLESHGWVQRDYEQRCAMYVDGRSTVCWVPNDFNADTIYGREQRQTMTATMVTLALRENRTVQAMLREINPRMRKGFPSEAALAEHDEWLVRLPWSVECVALISYGGSDNGFSIMIPPLGQDNEAEFIPCELWPNCWFWPCDDNANRVRWPTDSEGKML